ncbi:MbtH family NRPS accessory protein [Xenorhabdus szentirmaii]|uniref:MbtH-like domain-containing protein n=2 Tax=Xenorhabdus szentirmaii TaxID=290112 RepID=W1J252_9GAMM|nr:MULTISPECIES: MbtH family NRPS accessory protein [Xenorhabdus]MBD2781751.1 MbtH family protein [Xenorhabdus sp. 38]MBD2794079.1 MbtH family protein [Xenorhabdus sp. CUL]MBD2802984.1 MbtH family protein [Xenorhabdus sp. M]MBD2805829.1 MbtH family protein [Xenorhabdus sp. ZM]MBD2821597.1 MbtH family protein [Xenorhabdus sp. 42]
MKSLTKNDAMNWMVVINAKKQYSVWPSEYEIPMGWMAIGRMGSKEECLNHIAVIWPEPTKQQAIN